MTEVKEPKRPYEMVIIIGADDLQSLRGALNGITFAILEHEHKKTFRDKHTCTSGGPSAGYSYSLIRTETTDHDEYFKQVDEYLEAKDGETEKKL